MKKYIEITGAQNATHLKIETSYNLGGLNCFTGRTESRGYYLSVSPVELEKRDGYALEHYVAFSGLKRCIKNVSRRSVKAEAAAEEIAKNYVGELVREVCSRNGLPIPQGYEMHPEATEGGAIHV